MPSHKDTIASRLGRQLLRAADKAKPPEREGPNIRGYAYDPVGFARDILGVEPWSRQTEILETVCDNLLTAIVSGHRTGKSESVAILALWFYCSFPGARVVLAAPTAHQIHNVLWHAIKRLIANARVPIPIGGRLHKRATTGIEDPTTGAEIKGVTARESEAMQGLAGEHLLFLVDEASAVEDAIFEAIGGNRAGGGARLVMTGNPTRASGAFYDAFHSKKQLYKCIHIDSRESPNFVPGGRRIPGLADPAWLAERILDWGESGPLFEIRVAGNFAVAEEAKIFPVDALTAAQLRWHDTEPAPDDRLWIGLDPASGAEGGDETAFAVRRGKKVLDIVTRRGLNESGILVTLLDLLLTHAAPIDRVVKPCVVLDAEGGVGLAVRQALQAHLRVPAQFELAPVRGSLPAMRQPRAFATIRDELAANAKYWLLAGGAIPEHRKLEQELHTLEWLEGKKGGRTQLMKKDGPKGIRSLIGRSPDSADAFMLCCWEPLSLQTSPGPPREEPPPADVYEANERGINPYTSHDWMRGGGSQDDWMR